MLRQLKNKKQFEKDYVLRAYDEAIDTLEKGDQHKVMYPLKCIDR